MPLVLAFWAICVPLALSLWSNDDADAAARVPAAASGICDDLAGRMRTVLLAGDAQAAARLGHEQGRRSCPLLPESAPVVPPVQ